MNAQTNSLSRSHTPDAPVTYRIRVAGHLDTHWSDWLGDVQLAHHDDATTTVTVEVADQTQLHGILAGIRDIGAPLLDLHQVDEVRPTPDERCLDETGGGPQPGAPHPTTHPAPRHPGRRRTDLG